METKEINIAEILKDCPKGMSLYSVVYGEVKLSEVNNQGIFVAYKPENERVIQLHFFEDGKYNEDGECVLFPSSDQRNWSRFEPPVLPPFEIKRVPNDIYCFVDSYGEADEIMDYAGDRDKYRWEHGNYFNTHEQAEYAAKKVKELLLSLRKEEEK